MTAPLGTVVIGGGPGGLAAAIALRQAGARVLVLEPREMPIDKPCGEGLMPDAVAALSALGVELGDAGRPLLGISYFDSGIEARGLFPGAPGRGLRRLELHRRLGDRAVALGVEIRRVRATGLSWEQTGKQTPKRGQVTVVRAVCGAGKSGQGKSGQTEEIETDLVVAADGLRSKARAWAGLEKSKSMAALGQGRPRRFGVRRHFGVEPWSDRVEVHWSTGVEAYVTPCGPREVGIAVLFEEGALEPDLEPTLEPTRRSWERARTEPRGPALERLLVRFPALMRRLEGAEPTSKVRGIGPLWQETRAVQSGPVVLLGDASGYVDAITGEGMAIAFRQALALGAAFRDGRVERYAKAHRRLVRRPEWMTRLVLLLSSRPALRGRVLRALARDPALFDRLLAIHVGAAKPLGVVSSVARLGLGLAGAR